jgi:hypothetical protein
MPRQNRKGRARKGVRTIARRGSMAALNRNTDGRVIDRLTSQLREVNADGGR